MAWSEVVWFLYESPKGLRAVAPRKWHAPRGSKEHAKGIYHPRPLRPHELREGEALVGLARGVSRPAALAQHQARKVAA